MSDIEDVVRERLAVRAAHVDLTSDRADLDSRIARSNRRHDTVRNGLSLGGAALAVVLVVGLAYFTTSGGSPSVHAPVQATSVTDRNVARAEVAGAYMTVFQPGATDAQRLALIDNPRGLQPAINALRIYASESALETVRVHVDRATFSDATHAAIAFTVTSTHSASFDGVMHKQGGAVYVDGKWKLTRASFCTVMAEAGKVTHDARVYCPGDAP